MQVQNGNIAHPVMQNLKKSLCILPQHKVMKEINEDIIAKQLNDEHHINIYLK